MTTLKMSQLQGLTVQQVIGAYQLIMNDFGCDVVMERSAIEELINQLQYILKADDTVLAEAQQKIENNDW